MAEEEREEAPNPAEEIRSAAEEIKDVVRDARRAFTTLGEAARSLIPKPLRGLVRRRMRRRLSRLLEPW